MSKTKPRKEYEARFGVVDGILRLYNAKGNEIYYENSHGYWYKYEYDDKGNEIYYEVSSGYWEKQEYDAESNQIYRENSIGGVTLDSRPCSDKVFIDEQTGKKYKMTEIK